MPQKSNFTGTLGTSQPVAQKFTESDSEGSPSSPKKFMSSKLLNLKEISLSQSSDDTIKSDVNNDQNIEESKDLNSGDLNFTQTNLAKKTNKKDHKLHKIKRANSFKKN